MHRKYAEKMIRPEQVTYYLQAINYFKKKKYFTTYWLGTDADAILFSLFVFSIAISDS